MRDFGQIDRISDGLNDMLVHIERIENEITSLLETLERQPNQSNYQRLKTKFDFFHKLEAQIKQSIDRYITLAINDKNKSNLSTLENASEEFDEMMSNVLLMEERFTTVENDLTSSNAALSDLAQYVMPKTQSYVETVNEELKMTLKNATNFTEENIERIITINAKKLTNELFNGEKNDVLLNMHRGMQEHYVELLAKYDRILHGYDTENNNEEPINNCNGKKKRDNSSFFEPNKQAKSDNNDDGTLNLGLST